MADLSETDLERRLKRLEERVLPGGATTGYMPALTLGDGIAEVPHGDSDHDGTVAADPHDHTGQPIQPSTLRVTGGKGFLGLPNHHINYASGLSNEEIARFTLDAGTKLELWRLEVKLKGGGTNADVSVDVYDVSTSSIISSTSDKATGTDTPLGTSSEGATIILRVTNATVDPQDVCITGIKNIVTA